MSATLRSTDHAALAPRPDPTHLDAHVRACVDARGPLHRMKCGAEALDALIAPRFITSLALVTVGAVLLVSLLLSL
jgi:hypothetical protein